eukprot:scaffold261391_cov47-Attheya_sp.AAC.1
MDFEFDAIKMTTQGVKCVEGECVICEEREVETALAVAVARREQAGGPVSGTEAAVRYCSA